MRSHEYQREVSLSARRRHRSRSESGKSASAPSSSLTALSKGGFDENSHEEGAPLRGSPQPSGKSLPTGLAWLSYRCFTARGRERVPLFGEFGIVSQLGSADYARPRKFREKLEAWLKLVHAMWPECPAHVDHDGIALVVDRSLAVLPTLSYRQ